MMLFECIIYAYTGNIARGPPGRGRELIKHEAQPSARDHALGAIFS